MLRFILVITYMHVCVDVCPHMHVGTHRVQKKAAHSLALELQGAMSCLTMVLELTQVLWESSKGL